MLQLIDQLPAQWQDAIVAALLGDAFGVPHEFKQGYQVPVKQDLTMVMPEQYVKTYSWIPYGTWSDDGSQLLALLDTLCQHAGRYDEPYFGAQLLSWLHEAKYQAGGAVFDCGMQTRLALDSFAKGERFTLPGKHCGNGSLMRVLPVAAGPDVFGVTQRASLQIAMAQSDITHPQALARVCCALYVALVWRAQAGCRAFRAELPIVADDLRNMVALTPAEDEALDVILTYGHEHMLNNSGYVVNSLWSALWAVDRSTSLSDTLQNVVSAGGDTDTVACIAGGLANWVFGWDVLALEWRQQLCWPASC